MFEAHGWATIRAAPGAVEPDPDGHTKLLDELERLREGINVVPRLDIGLNGFGDVLTVTAFTNHRCQPVIDLFAWLAQHRPGSYGLLYVHDAEDLRQFDNEFRVWRLRRGRLDELPDPFLSPLIRATEDPYGSEKGR